MARLIYSAIASLDGYVEDENGQFGWARPDEEVHAFVNELERPIGAYLYGRRMYDTMVFWETAATSGEPAVFRDYAELWRTAEKIVYSRTLEKVSSARTRVEREFDPDAIRALKRTAAADIGVGGGKPAWPHHVRADLEVIDERRFESGVVHISYQVTSAAPSGVS